MLNPDGLRAKDGMPNFNPVWGVGVWGFRASRVRDLREKALPTINQASPIPFNYKEDTSKVVGAIYELSEKKFIRNTFSQNPNPHPGTRIPTPRTLILAGQRS